MFLFSAFYLNELICRIWPADAQSDGLFSLYQQSLHNLARFQGDPPMLQPILRQFEFALILAELGIAVDFSSMTH
ncbi:MAG: DNA repair protein RecO C-terminal domain-containing protein [Rheinheimera sp.]|nr:DNA repair protein RecO C-terminal domain-containing protein [Rheinheimera sp.]